MFLITSHMSASSRPLNAVPAEHVARQIGYFQELAELNMTSARIAGDRIRHAHANDGDTSPPTLDLARSTRAVVQSVNAENRLHLAAPPPRAAEDDSRRAPLRKALVQAARSEPNAAIRADLGHQIETSIEQALVEDPDAETPIYVHLCTIARALNLKYDGSKLSDDVLGLKSEKYPQPGAIAAAPADPGPW